MRIEKTNDHLEGVKCVVNTCYYYLAGDRCSAAKIEINQGMQLILRIQTVLHLGQTILVYRIKIKAGKFLP